MTILASGEGEAYILHNYAIPLSYGFHVYRRIENQEWQRLTTEPVFPVQNGYQLELQLGTQFDFIKQELGNDNPQEIFLSIRAQTGANTVIHAAVPELALLLGRAYVDQTAPFGSLTAYRFEIVDDLERPSGTVFEHSARLTPPASAPAARLTAENTDRTVAMEWNYPTPDQSPGTEEVIRFNTLYRDTETDEWVDATDAILIRRSDESVYRKIITVPERGREYEFWVEAIDISGQLSSESERVTLYIEDNVPPGIVNNVRAEVNEAYESEIAWPVSTEPDLAGYHVYKARGEVEEYTRLTEELLPPLQTFYLHSDTEPGVQYRYAVTAVDQNENEGPLSNPAHVYIWDDTIPEPVTGLQAVFDSVEKSVHLGWEAGEQNTALRTYQILRRQTHPAAASVYDQLNDEAHTGLNWTDHGYENEGFREGATYGYAIVTVGQNGNRSDTVRTYLQIPDLTPPDPPAGMQVRMASGERVQLSWDASVSGDVATYRVYRGESSANDPELLTENDKGSRFFQDQNAELNGLYHYSVTAVDSVGNESLPLFAEPFTVHRLHPPVPSRNVQAVYANGRVYLQWQVQGESQIAGFGIYRSDMATGTYERIGEASSGDRKFECDTGCVPGQWFKVYPFDIMGREARTARSAQAVEQAGIPRGLSDH